MIDKTKNKANFMNLKDIKSVPNARPVPEHLASCGRSSGPEPAGPVLLGTAISRNGSTAIA